MLKNLSDIKSIYFLGIGGIGMSALARYFNSRGKKVSGYDRTETDLTRELSKEGIEIHFEDDPGQIPADIDLVIYTPAIPSDLKEFISLSNSGLTILKRSVVLGMITDGKKTVAVAGSHGKTSITSMIAHILFQAGFKLTALTGGISRNYNSNYISTGEDEIMVVEADEYDRSFLQLHPDIAVISAMDADHLDIYKTRDEMAYSFGTFASQIKPAGKLFIRNDIQLELKSDIRRIDYAVETLADLYAGNVRVENGTHVFDLISCDQQSKNISLNVPGKHNIENALAAYGVCKSLGASNEQILKGLRSYTGVRRRFDIRVREEGGIYIDDYAHHPAEIRAFISAVRELYPSKRICGIFQPHLYSRTRDFAEGFASSLDLLDEIFLLEIYPAREKPIPGISSVIILNKIKNNHKKLVNKEELLELIKSEKPEVLLTMGAGNIDQLVGPIEKIRAEIHQ